MDIDNKVLWNQFNQLINVALWTAYIINQWSISKFHPFPSQYNDVTSMLILSPWTPRYPICRLITHYKSVRSLVSLVSWGRVRLSPLVKSTTVSPTVPTRMIHDGDCRATGGMKIDRGNRRTRRKPVPMQLRSPQIPHDPTRARTRAAVVGSRYLTTWVIARP
jgi:hypothetical protein